MYRLSLYDCKERRYFYIIGNFASYYTKMLRKDAHDVQKKAALQPRIGAQSETSPSRIEGFREFKADLSALFYVLIRRYWYNEKDSNII